MQEGRRIKSLNIRPRIFEQMLSELGAAPSSDVNVKLSDIIEFLPDAALAVDRNRQIIIWNRAIEEMTGFPASEMIGRGDYAYTIPFYGEARPQLIDLIFGDTIEIEYRHLHINRYGNSIWAETYCNALYNNTGAWIIAKATPLYDTSGNIIGAMEIIRDITKQKKAEKEIEEKNAILQQMLDGSQDIIGFQYPDHTIIRYNKAGYDLLKISPKDISGKKCYELLGRNTECDECATKKACISKKVETIEKFQPEIGKYLKVTANPIIDNNGKIIYIIEQLTDIDTRKKAEIELRESEKRFKSLLENVEMVAVQGYDSQRRVVYWNKASEFLYGYTKSEAIGSQLENLIIPEAMRDEVVQRINRWLEFGEPIPPGELQLLRKDGSSVPVYSSHVMQKKSDGEKEIYCVDVDLTEVKKVTDQLLQAKEQAEKSNIAKSEFLANMSHEIRTPLNGIMGMLQVMQETSLDTEQNEYLNMAINSSRRLARLLNDILDLTKIEADKLEIKEEVFSITEVMQSIQDIFTHAAKENKNSLNIEFTERFPGSLIGDSTRLTQILFNLVGNAIKYTEKGQVDVSVHPLPSEKDDRLRILFSVTDTGLGLHENTIDQVFETFTQAGNHQSPYTRKFEGAGLGLPLVKRLVSLMGGNLSVDSAEGVGTTVHVSLPFTILESKEPEGSHSLNMNRSANEQARSILLVDDDEATKIHVKRMLEKAGLQVHLADNGETALAELARAEFQCILMDVQMPVLDGVEACKRIRSSNSNFSHIPIIALTAYAMEGDKERFLEAGMDDYVTKPVDHEELMRVLKRNLVGYH
jgi:PAS domain S-box-containing protein